MLSRKALAIASLCTIVCAQAHSADDKFKSAEFLTWSDAERKSYIATSVLMAVVIAGGNSPEQENCIKRWSADNDGAGYPTVKAAMVRFPEHHPTGVVVAVLEKACGSFKYVAK
jgi:hypothetical protein